MSPLQIQWNRIRRRWVMIVVIALVAGVGALGASLLQGTTYTGRAALTIVSQDRAPEQDTVLAQGYADYFNQASSQEVLRQTAGVPSSVSLNARIAAASPIVYIEATSTDSAEAADASTKMAVALRDDVNQGLQGDSARQIAELQGQLQQAQAANNSNQVSQLQDQIETLQSDTNQLQDLQLNAGVAANSANVLRNAGAAVAGALLLGALLAIALGRFENRIVTPSEVSDRLGLQVLAVVGGRRRADEDARSQLLRSLMGLTNAYGMPTPGSLAITGPQTARASKSRVAVALAGLRALQGQTTLLLQTDLDGERLPSELSSLPGVADFLAERGGSRIDGKVFANGRALLVGPPGSKRDDLFALYSRSSLQRLLTQGTMLADLVVIDAPPVESSEGQVVCGTADRSVLVVEEGKTRARDASAALDALGRVGGTALGAIVIRNPGQLHDPGFLKEGNWTPVRLPSAPQSGRPAGPPPPGAPAGPDGSGPAGQVPPADRTQPISQKKLEEAREAMAREPGNVAAVVAGAGAKPNGATNGSRGPAATNGAPADGPAARRNDKPTDANGRAPVAPPPTTDGPKPEAGTGSASKPAPAGPARNGAAANGPADAAPAAKSGAPVAPAPKAPSPPAAAGPKAPAPQTSAAKAPGNPAPANGTPSGPEAADGPAARITRRSPGADAKPSPRPKPADPPPARGAAPKSSEPGTPSAAPGAPEGAKRVGTARFSSSAGSPTSSSSSSSSSSAPAPTASTARGADATRKTNGKSDLSAPTVTLRTEK